MFLNMFLKHPEVIKSMYVPVYFKTSAVSEADKKAVEDLVYSINGGKTRLNQVPITKSQIQSNPS